MQPHEVFRSGVVGAILAAIIVMAFVLIGALFGLIR
jgi:hypothetical protein